MELAAGRSSKESSSGRGGGGSDSGRYGRSEREKGPSAGGVRDYAREGGGRSGDRDRDRRGGEKQRRKGGSVDSRGGSGSSRSYGDRREEKGYRYSSHRDRSSRWEVVFNLMGERPRAQFFPPVFFFFGKALFWVCVSANNRSNAWAAATEC